MTTRTSMKTVTFRSPFVVGGSDEVLPAGVYEVETDEELLEGISFRAYRRKSTRVHLHPKPGHPGLTQTLIIDPKELDAALKRDQAPEVTPVGRDAGQEIPDTGRTALKGTMESRREELDRQDLDRADVEGMIVHPR